MLENWKNRIKEKRILIVGFGREGISTYRFIRKYFQDKEIGIADKLRFTDFEEGAKSLVKKDKNLTLHLGKDYLDSLLKYDLVIKSPGVSPYLPKNREAKKKGVEFSSQTKIFFELYKGLVIGVTGTKGKSTTTALIYHILKKTGKSPVLLGNIGYPALDKLQVSKEIIYVFELSSHQLAELDKSPEVAVFLNIFKEHMDYYENFNRYREVKANIIRYQKAGDYFIYNKDFEYLNRLTKRTKSKKLTFSLKSEKANCFLRDRAIYLNKEKVITLDELKLRGEHNALNCMAAILVANTFNLPSTRVAQAIKSFKPLEHRLEVVGRYSDITFINDSIATMPEAAIVALKTFKSEVGTIIVGGYDRKQSYSKLANALEKEKVNNIVFFPTTGKRIWKEVKKAFGRKKLELPKHIFTSDIREAVKFAFENTPKGKVCLLSPAAPSFGVFKDYRERGRVFKKAVFDLQKMYN